MRGQCCGNCDAFAKSKDAMAPNGVPQGWCRAKPPLLIQTMVAVNSKLDPRGQQVAPGFQGVFPPTAADVWCREWKPRFNKHEMAAAPFADDEDEMEVIDVKPS